MPYIRLPLFLLQTLIAGSLLFILFVTLPAAARDIWPDVSGVWHKDFNPKSRLKLILKQEGPTLSGYFQNGDTKWPVEGHVSPDGAIQMFRRFPLSELPREATPDERRLLYIHFGDPARPGYLIGPVDLRYGPDGSLSGEYIRYGVAGTRVNAQGVRIEMGLAREPLLADRNTRFHRLFIIGAADNPLEQHLFDSETTAFKELLDRPDYQKFGSTAQIIPYDERRRPSFVLNAIKGMKYKARNKGDQVLIYISAHGSGGMYGETLNKVYMPIYEAELMKFVNTHGTAKDRSKVRRFRQDHKKLDGKDWVNLYNNTLSKYLEKFKPFFRNMIQHGVIKKKDGEEFYREYFRLTRFRPDRNYIHDYEFADAIKPILEAHIPLTVIIDACFGGGFADNIDPHANVVVIGFSKTCPGPIEPFTDTITDVAMKAVREKPKPAVVTSHEVREKLRGEYPLAVGVPYDDLRDVRDRKTRK